MRTTILGVVTMYLHFNLVSLIATALQLLSQGSVAFVSVHRITLSRQLSSSTFNSRHHSRSQAHKKYSHKRWQAWSRDAASTSSNNYDPSCHLLLNRRNLLTKSTKALSASTIAMLASPSSSSSSSSTTSALQSQDKIYLRGTVTLQPGQSIPLSINSSAALYITVRPNVPDDAPKAILDGTRGKSPPVLSARFPVQQYLIDGGDDLFPFHFELTDKNLTPEGAIPLQIISTTVAGEQQQQQPPPPDEKMILWWENSGNDLITSARLDMDGVASTRDPDDLVGRGISYRLLENKNTDAEFVSIELRRRGTFGKSVTTRKKI